MDRRWSPWGFPWQEYWSGLPCPSPGNLPNPGIEPRSPALQADSIPSEPPGKPLYILIDRSFFNYFIYSGAHNNYTSTKNNNNKRMPSLRSVGPSYLFWFSSLFLFFFLLINFILPTLSTLSPRSLFSISKTGWTSTLDFCLCVLIFIVCTHSFTFWNIHDFIA